MSIMEYICMNIVTLITYIDVYVNKTTTEDALQIFWSHHPVENASEFLFVDDTAYQIQQNLGVCGRIFCSSLK